jgi:hypothetical protein
MSFGACAWCGRIHSDDNSPNGRFLKQQHDNLLRWESDVWCDELAPLSISPKADQFKGDLT